MKRDINFIKHIKPQLKEKERVDKAEGRQKRYEKVCRAFDIEPPAIGVEDVGIITSIMRRMRK
jgi:hypothetical protein